MEPASSAPSAASSAPLATTSATSSAFLATAPPVKSSSMFLSVCRSAVRWLASAVIPALKESGVVWPALATSSVPCAWSFLAMIRSKSMKRSMRARIALAETIASSAFLAPAKALNWSDISTATALKCGLTLAVTRAPLPPVRSPSRMLLVAAIEASIASSGVLLGAGASGASSTFFWRDSKSSFRESKVVLSFSPVNNSDTSFPSISKSATPFSSVK